MLLVFRKVQVIVFVYVFNDETLSAHCSNKRENTIGWAKMRNLFFLFGAYIQQILFSDPLPIEEISHRICIFLFAQLL